MLCLQFGHMGEARCQARKQRKANIAVNSRRLVGGRRFTLIGR